MTIEPLENQSVEQRRVETHEIGAMLRYISMEYGIPAHKYDELATAITKEYKVNCMAQDVLDYEHLYSYQPEDWALEGRRQAHGITSGLREVF